MKRVGYAFFCLVAVAVCFLGGGLLASVSQAGQELEYDPAMETERYTTKVEVREDGSYQVEEQIEVNMLEERHGIYRYIPRHGTSVYRDQAGELQKVPYHGKVELLEASAPAEVSEENGCTVFRLGSEDETVSGPVGYKIRYRFTPRFQEEGYPNAYYNVFPGMWQNPIPAGSSFSVAFPKAFDHESLRFYAGAYGSERDGADMLKLQWSGDTLEGTLEGDLKLGEGVTFFAPMPEGYFAQARALAWPKYLVTALVLAGFGAVVALFLAFGRDETIYPSIQYQPPQGIDSAAVGYIIDGAVEDRDVLSLIIYWADQGFLTIEEKKKGKIRLHRVRPLPADAPDYAQTMFRELFKKGDVCKIEKLSGRFYDTIGAVKVQVKRCFQGERALYTKSSRLARRAAGVLCAIPFGGFILLAGATSRMGIGQGILYMVCYVAFLAGAWIICYGVDTWHSKSTSHREWLMAAGAALVGMGLAAYGGSYLQRAQDREVFSYISLYIIVCAASVGMVLLTAFMNKRTHTCVEWMGRLLGLRDFIETAELDRLQALAEETPQVFYHILPYAYVMGLSDVYAHKLKGLALEPPQWYRGSYGDGGYLDYSIFHRSLMRSMDTARKSLAVPEPPKAPDSSFSGGGISGGGGGFSGGGFGGGGGGSW